MAYQEKNQNANGIIYNLFFLTHKLIFAIKYASELTYNYRLFNIFGCVNYSLLQYMYQYDG